MTRSMLFAAASVAAVLAASLALGGVAAAQTPPATGQQAAPGGQAVQQPGAQPPGGPGYAGGAGPVLEGQPWPIIFVATVELLRSKDGRDIVLARGLVTSKGWAQPNLIPTTQRAPVDRVRARHFDAK